MWTFACLKWINIVSMPKMPLCTFKGMNIIPNSYTNASVVALYLYTCSRWLCVHRRRGPPCKYCVSVVRLLSCFAKETPQSFWPHFSNHMVKHCTPCKVCTTFMSECITSKVVHRGSLQECSERKPMRRQTSLMSCKTEGASSCLLCWTATLRV